MIRYINVFIKNKKFKYFYYAISSILLLTFFAVFFGYHFFLKPNIALIKSDIETFVSKETGGEVSIEMLNVDWNITNPRFQIRNFSVTDRDNNKTINLQAVDFELSWLSIFKFKPLLNQIIIGDIDVLVERTVDDKLKIAGIEIIESKDSKLSDWLLNQKDIKIINGQITWRDHKRNAADLVLQGINFHFTSPAYLSYLDRHKFKLNTKISTATKQRITISGSFDLGSIDEISKIKSDVIIDIPQAYIPAFKPWIDYPFDVKQGYGDLKLKAIYANNSFQEIKSIFNIDNYIGNFNVNENNYIKIDELSGSALYQKNNSQIRVIVNDLNFNAKDIKLKKSALEISVKEDQPVLVKLKMNELNIDAAETLLNQTPFFTEIKNQLKNYNPSGLIKNLQFSWEKNSNFILSGSFVNFGISEYESWPMINNLSAVANIKNKAGTLEINSKDLDINHSAFLRSKIQFDSLGAMIRWDGNNINIKNATLLNQDLFSSFAATANVSDSKNPEINLTANFTAGNVSQLKKYYPKNTDPEILSWLDTSLLNGSLDNFSIKYKGQPSNFPFNNNNGEFKISGFYKNVKIEFATGYPEIVNSNFHVEVNNNLVKMTSTDGKIANQNIRSLTVESDLTDKLQNINVDWIIDGSVSDFVKTVNNTPLYEDTAQFTNQLVSSGQGRLNLKMIYPVTSPDDLTFNAFYELNNASFENLRIGLPKIENFNARLNIKNNSYGFSQAKATLLNMPITIDLSNQDDNTKIVAYGKIDEDFFIKNLGPTWLGRVEGSSDWILESNISKLSSSLSITSDLKGLAIDGPKPFKKQKNEVKLLSVVKKPTVKGKTNFVLTLDNSVNGKVYLDAKNNLSGQINILNNEPFQDRNGLSFFANFKEINFSDFASLLKTNNDQSSNFKFGESKINFEKLVIDGLNLNRLEAKILPSKIGIKLALYSNEIKGNMLWDMSQNKVIGRFNKVIIKTEEQPGQLTKKNNFKTFDASLEFDFKIDQIVLNEKNYGKVELIAVNSDSKTWNIKNLTIINEHNTIIADGKWIAGEQNSQSKMNFKWKIDNLEKTLEQFNYPNLVKKGNARLNGIANWEGSPFDFSPEQLSGNFSMDVQKGEILEAEPGIGRLFGLLTLQNLPKRLSLDFSDLFSKGFIFDSINAGVRMNQGILSSNNFKMMGPAAEVNIDGEVDMIAETQNLQVIVKPFVSDSLSLAALAGGPLVGAAAFIAQKILKDPFNKVLTDEYQITGTWDDPIETDKPKSEELSKLVDEEVIKPSESILKKLNIFSTDKEKDKKNEQ